MNFSKEQLESLKQIRDNHEKIVVSGINSLGDRFLTTCYIDNNRAMLSCFIPAIYCNSHFRANLATDHHSVNEYSNALTIDEISLTDGTLIYKNKDIEAYKQQAEELKNEFEAKTSALGLNIVEDDLVTSVLRKKIGRPVIIDKQAGVLTIITNCNYDGTVTALLSNGNTSQLAYVTKNSKLYSLRLSGEARLDAENKYASSTDAIFKAREERVKQALLANFENETEIKTSHHVSFDV